MNVGWWDFEWYANDGVCVFDGAARTDSEGFEFVYDQAGDEMVYSTGGDPFMKYELGSANDTDWGWYRWDTGDWTPWEDSAGNSYALRTASYSGHSSELLYDGAWRALPGGHGNDSILFESADPGSGGTYTFGLADGHDFLLDYTNGANVAPTVNETLWGGPTTADWTYIGESMFVFQSSGEGGIDQQWTVYDGSTGVNDAWFTYRCAEWDDSTGWGSWDFNGVMDLAFLSAAESGDGNPYLANEAYLKDNVISIVGDTYDSASLSEIVAMMDAISQSQGGIFFDTVMFHGAGVDPDNPGLLIGNTVIDDASMSTHAGQFAEMASLMLGDGRVGHIQFMQSYSACDSMRSVMTAIQGCCDGNGPWGSLNTPIVWGGIDTTGDWNSAAGGQPNWSLEWSEATFDPANPYANAAPLSDLLYWSVNTADGATLLAGDTADVNQAPESSLVPDLALDEDFGAHVYDVSGYFTDPDGDDLTYELGSVSYLNGLSLDSVVIDPNTGRITFYSAADANGYALVKVRAFDGADYSGWETFTLTVNGVNDAPTQTVNSLPAVAEDSGPVDLGAVFSVSETEPGSVWVELSSQAGFAGLTVTPTAGVAVFGNGTGSLLLTGGDVARINDALATLTGTLIGDFNGTARIDIRTTDGDGASSPTQSFTLTVNATNDGPEGTTVPDVALDEDFGTYVYDVSGYFSDIDTGSLTYELGTITYHDGLSMDAVTINGTTGEITFDDALNAAGYVEVQVRAYDGAEYSGWKTFTVTVDPVNDAPVNTVPVAQTTDEDTPLVFSVGNGNAISVSDADAGGGSMNVILSVQNGTLTVSQTTGLIIFSGANGTKSLSFTGSAAAINAALEGLTYDPDADWNGADTLTLSVNDRGNSGSGGEMGDSDTVAITVNATNDAPEGTTVPDVALDEDFGTYVYDVSGYFSDVDTATLTYELGTVSDPSGVLSVYSINPTTGKITFESSFNQFGILEVEVRAFDGTGYSDWESFVVEVNHIVLDPFSLIETGVSIHGNGTFETLATWTFDANHVNTLVGDPVGMALIMDAYVYNTTIGGTLTAEFYLYLDGVLSSYAFYRCAAATSVQLGYMCFDEQFSLGLTEGTHTVELRWRGNSGLELGGLLEPGVTGWTARVDLNSF